MIRILTLCVFVTLFCRQAVDTIHQVGVYCLALVPPNYLPKTPLGGIHLWETRKRFEEGSLHPANVLMCPHTCVTNLPKVREKGRLCLSSGQSADKRTVWWIFGWPVNYYKLRSYLWIAIYGLMDAEDTDIDLSIDSTDSSDSTSIKRSHL